MMTTPSLQRCIGSIIVLLLFCATARGQQDSGQQDSGRQDKRDAAAAQFDREIAPLMASYCLDCHRGVKPEGGLDLSRGASASRGGESGPAIDAKDPLNSLLWRRIVDGEMPPKEKLPDADRDKLKQWIGAGAKWGTEVIDPFQYTTSKRAGFDWWALQPLSKPEPPVVKAQDQVANPIDAFLLTKLEAAQLSYSPQAAPRVLVRRLHFDLIGLPPTPEVVAAFEKDPSEAAYQQLIADLLASPDYGERWGRHWLDVARFGESDGFERNNPRENLWRYRDWVIAALNQDMPYDEFVRQQIAGDLLNPGDADGVAAVGFLVSGVHNTVVGSSEFMRRLAREDELEEVIGAVAQTFIGLTVNCARCHDHKFDPIPQVEFYRITAAIDGVAHGEREVVRAVDQKRLDQLNADIARLNEQIDAVESTARQDVLAARKDGKAKPAPAPRPLAHWDFESDFRDRAGSLHGKPVAGAKIENGALLVDGKTFVETAPLEKKLVEKTLEATVLLSNLTQRGGSAISVETTNGVVFDAIVFGEREVTKWMAGSNGFVRTDSFQGPEEKEAKAKPVHFAIVYSADGTITGYRNGVLYGKAYKSKGVQTFQPGSTHVAFGIRHKPAGGNKMLTGKILDAKLYDRALSVEEVAAAAGEGANYVPLKQLLAAMTPEDRAKRAAWVSQRDKHSADRDAILRDAKFKVYTVAARKPAARRYLPRGDVMKPGEQVKPGAIAALANLNADFALEYESSDQQRRVALANWFTDRQNGLLARVIVNRVWHYHFGVGIVETPNDFGFNGGRPSHPQLLDWLASEFQRQGYRLKTLHRMIVSTNAYRQRARFDNESGRVDAGNRLLWRKSPLRIEAEVLRDSLLFVSGKLNMKRGGPGFRDVKVTPNNGTTYYTPIDREDEAFHRRTVYRFSPRGGRSALLDTFDCPDPSSTAPRRNTTTTPLQALSLLNNSLVLRMSDHFAQRVKDSAGDRVSAQVAQAYQFALNRNPDSEERELAAQFVTEHGLAAFARALFNSNEFVMVE